MVEGMTDISIRKQNISTQGNRQISNANRSLRAIATAGLENNCALHSLLPALADSNRLAQPEFLRAFNDYYQVSYDQEQFKKALLTRYRHPEDLSILFGPVMRRFLVDERLPDYQDQLFAMGNSEQLFAMGNHEQCDVNELSVSINGYGTFKDLIRGCYTGQNSRAFNHLKNIFSPETLKQIRRHIWEKKYDVERLRQIVDDPRSHNAMNQKDIDKKTQAHAELDRLIDNKLAAFKQIWQERAFGEYQRYLKDQKPYLDETDLKPLADYFGVNINAYAWVDRPSNTKAGRYRDESGYKCYSQIACAQAQVQANQPSITIVNKGDCHFEALLPENSERARLASEADPQLSAHAYGKPEMIKQALATNQTQSESASAMPETSSSNSSDNKQEDKMGEPEWYERKEELNNSISYEQYDKNDNFYASIKNTLANTSPQQQAINQTVQNTQDHLQDTEQAMSQAHVELNDRWQKICRSLAEPKQTTQDEASNHSSYDYVDYIDSFFQSNQVDHDNKFKRIVKDGNNEPHEQYFKDMDPDYRLALKLQEEEFADYFQQLENESNSNFSPSK